MAKNKHKSLVASLSSRKKEVTFIGSGATHHFFYERRYFESYVEIGDAEVEIASSSPRLVGKGIVTLPIENGIKVTEYHAPEFEANIVCPRLLSQTYDISSSEFFKPYNACFLFKPGTHDIVAEYPLKDMMYPINMTPHTCEVKDLSSKMNTKCNDVDLWHRKVGHPHPERYIVCSRMFADVPSFDRATLQEHLCVPCLISKATRAPI